MSCSSKPTDMRTLVPSDTLVYLETNDLGAALQPITDSKPFNEVAKKKPDLSTIKGVQLAVAITGFETSEEKVNEEQAIGKIQPHFVAIADTHAWQFQTTRFAEQKLGAFVADIYDSEPTLEEHEKGGGHYLTWTAKDGRKAFALVKGSLIYFGNDESSIEKSLAVARGEADSIAKTGKVPVSDPDTLASGYVSQDGVAQIANVFALKLAQDASDEGEVQSAIASIVPQLVRKNITDLRWTATKTDQGYEDKWQIGMPAPGAQALAEATQLGSSDNDLLNYLVSDYSVISRYNFKNPIAAWAEINAGLKSAVDPTSARMIDEFGNLLFEPFGIGQPSKFLNSVRSNMVTVRCDRDGEEAGLITRLNGSPPPNDFLLPNMKVTARANLASLEFSSDEGMSAFIDDAVLISGNKTCTDRFSAESFLNKTNQEPTGILKSIARSDAPITTIGRDTALAPAIADMLSEKKSDEAEAEAASAYFTETRFTKVGIERKTTSDFGFIGWIIAQLAEE
ncbi:MAG: hypothetical protein JO053_11150 [Acidobacteria bacterium]|nr:hypothetical protein [Acidobacteriota bacterium]